MATYRKKYTDIEAIVWDGSNIEVDVLVLSDFIWGTNRDQNPKIEVGINGRVVGSDGKSRTVLWLKNCNGTRIVNPGDFVVKAPNGCVYPLCPESFHSSYELVG